MYFLFFYLAVKQALFVLSVVVVLPSRPLTLALPVRKTELFKKMNR